MFDLRSDTVTRPTPAMREAMLSAPMGDDVYGEDPTVNALEAHAADLFGMEAALFCSSGTQTNQIALLLHGGTLSEIICHRLAHVYYYEGGGISFNGRASVALLEGERGKLTAETIADHINPDDIHRPRTRCVALENTANRGGGACYAVDDLYRIRHLCQTQELKLHLDGARLFNALVATGQSARTYGSLFDSISVCLSKGLGAPVGSLLLGSAGFIREARRVRKVLGGGWRQAGMLAAAGLYALRNHVARLADDHALARELGAILQQYPWVTEILPVETNIVLTELRAESVQKALLEHLWASGIWANGVGSRQLRLVTHLDVSPEVVQVFREVCTTFQADFL